MSQGQIFPISQCGSLKKMGSGCIARKVYTMVGVFGTKITENAPNALKSFESETLALSALQYREVGSNRLVTPSISEIIWVRNVRAIVIVGSS